MHRTSLLLSRNVIEPLEARIAPALVYAVTADNKLISFDSATPGTILSTIPITGLVGGGTEHVAGIDFRPSTGELYALGINDFDAGDDEALLYTLNLQTGVASNIQFMGGGTQIDNDFTDGSHYGFTFDPVADVIRLTNVDGRNSRVDPNTGFLIANDTALSAGPIFAAAYDHPVAGAKSSTLFGLSFNSTSVVRIGDVGGSPGSANSGTVTTLGALGFQASFIVGALDFATTGEAFAVIEEAPSGKTNLYRIAPGAAAGAATKLGLVGDGTVLMAGMAVAPGDLVIAKSGKSATYTDIDGDKVTVTLTKGKLTAAQFTFRAGELGSQLLRFEFATNPADKPRFEDAGLTFAASPVKKNGDGYAHVGLIDAGGIDLGKVTVDGDLGRIFAGDDSADGDMALASLTVHSVGALGTSTQLPGGELGSTIKGRLGALNIKTDLIGARIATLGVKPSVGNVTIGGDIIASNDGTILAGVDSYGSMGNVTIGGSIVGGSVEDDGALYIAGNMGKATVGGSLLGGAGKGTGAIQCDGAMGALVIKGDLVGGGGDNSGFVRADHGIASVTVGGSLLGGTAGPVHGDSSGAILTDGDIPGAVKIGGDLVGGLHTDSGSVSAGGKIGAVTIGGSMLPQVADTGYVQGVNGVASVKVGGELRSATAGAFYLFSRGPIGALTVGGSVVNGRIAGQTLGTVTIGGDLRGEAAMGVAINAESVPDKAAPAIKSLTVKGSVVNALVIAGSPVHDGSDGSVGAVNVTGNWISSSLVAGAGIGDFRYGNEDDVKITEAVSDTIFSTIASITIGGFVSGTTGGTDHFGFVAEKIGSLKAGGVKVPLASGLDKVGFALGVTGDVRVREIDELPANFSTAPAPATQAPLIYAISDMNELVTFRADAPGTILGTIGLTGLGPNEHLDGLDFRPATGQLYALGIDDSGAGTDTGRLLRIDPATGAVTAVGAPFSTTLAGTQHYGFDFDPASDQVRIVSTDNTNLRLDPETGAVFTDVPVAYIGGALESIYAVAYDHNFRGAGSTLYAIDFFLNALVRIGDVGGSPASANGGALTTIGPGLGFDANDMLGSFDIEARTGVAYATVYSNSGPHPFVTSLYKIDLATGLATDLGAINSTTRIHGTAIAMPNDLTIVSDQLATYHDEDGDLVTVKTSRGKFEANQFTLATGEFGSQLVRFEPGSGIASGADLTFTAAPDKGRGDGFANVGFINALGLDLGKVSIDGDLGRILAGDPISGGVAIASLTAHSIGLFGTATQTPGGDLLSILHGRLGALTVKTDIVNARIDVTDTTAANGSVGHVTIGGSLLGGSAKSGIFAKGAIGNVKIGGSLVGGSVAESSKIGAGATMGSLSIGGSIVGGSALESGAIKIFGRTGAVKIGGSVLGGTAVSSGVLLAGNGFVSITLAGSIAGHTVANPMSDAGSGLVGAYFNGTDQPTTGAVKIGGSLRGANGYGSGAFFTLGNTDSITVSGSLSGGGSTYSGSIVANGNLGPVKIGGDVRGGGTKYAGSVLNLNSEQSIGSVNIGGSLVGGGDKLIGIIAGDKLGAVTIAGSMRGLDPAHTVRISAAGKQGTIDGITSITVKGSVRQALIEADYSYFGLANNFDAGLGAVTVGGNWLGSSLAAGAIATVGDNYGDADDKKVTEAMPNTILAKIASITIKGFAAGTPTIAGDHFGFVAEVIGSLTIGTWKAPLTTGSDTGGFGITGDLRVREV